ncbi:MAG: DUF262 domain-containing protein, partial [Nanoarchaeota archaeon]|nr:DUF262 domain-containing protein [Nanoarchaeota archaeon]
ILEILDFQNLDQFIVPEIQRDYVWDVNDVLDLLESIIDGFGGDEEAIPYLGFIYAYNDKDYVYKYFLVDGQQRMTTVYLLLLACHLKMSKKLPDYLFKNEKLKLDYKVRQATHDFLMDLVNHCQNNQNSYDFNIENQVWYHKDYENDRTICNIIKNFDAIINWLNNIELEQMPDFLKFVENKVELSYFDIQNGREGEELYIYMNSRGRQLEANETLKAKFLAKIENIEKKEQWGRKWEEWQDFFWKYRGNNPDADAGFNEFLQRIQIITMCDLGKTNDEVSRFASGKSNQKLDIDLLPRKLDEIEKYFQSFKWLVESVRVRTFFEQYEPKGFLTTTPDAERRQIYYLRILPVLALLHRTGLMDEEVIVRFIRFFYNVARKLNVGKDIAAQLPSAIKLMLDYGENKNSENDVCDLIDYQKGRTVLIDEEEVLKLSMYKRPLKVSTRQELEGLFWAAEDHPIFNGEIMFLLEKYYDKESHIMDLSNYKKTWSVFKALFLINNENNALISRALLYYRITWVIASPGYYNNYNCHDWYTLVRVEAGKYLLNLLEDLHGKQVDYLDVIIRKKTKHYFNSKKWTSIDSIKSVETLFDQVRVLTAIDYYSDKTLWKDKSYIAEDIRFSSYTYSDTPFFTKDILIYNVTRYIGDGWQGRVLKMMENILKDEIKLGKILNDILSFE